MLHFLRSIGLPFNAHLVIVRVPVLVLSVSNKALPDPMIHTLGAPAYKTHDQFWR